MTKIKILFSGLALSLILTVQAQAQKDDLSKIYTECGIGAMIFKNSTTGATISNVIWDLGTTASSSHYSSEKGCKGRKTQVAMLIGNTYDKLDVEIAEGKGKYIETLSKLSGKSISEIRTKFTPILASKEYTTMTKMEKSQKLFNIVSK